MPAGGHSLQGTTWRLTGWSASSLDPAEYEITAESIYLDLLRKARKHAVTKTTLTLKDEGGQDILIFEASEGGAADRP